MTADFTPFSVKSFYNHQTVRRSRLLGPTFCWRTFYRQSEAFDFAEEYAEDLSIFSFESATDPTLNKGQRKYLATSLPVFWHYYSQLADTKKAHYEIIPEGSACKLYFDLEFQREYNSTSHGSKMTDIFIKYVCSWLKVCFALDLDRSHVLDLDASTTTKFSRHLIFQLPGGAVFENNVIAGNFVHHIMAALVHHMEKHSDLSLKLAAATESSSEIPQTSRCTCDLPASEISSACSSVEHCSQSFCSSSHDVIKDFLSGVDDDLCLLGDSFSSKFLGASAASQRTHFDCKTDQECRDSGSYVIDLKTVPCDIPKDTFSPETQEDKHHCPLHVSSSTTDVRPLYGENAKKVFSLFTLGDLQSLFIRKKDNSFTTFCDLGVYTRNRNFRIFLSSKLNKNNPLVLSKENIFKPESERESFECDIFFASLVSHARANQSTAILSFDDQGISRSMKRKAKFVTPREKKDITLKSESMEGWNSASPFPEVDAFVGSMITSHGHLGSIRHWTYFVATETLVYDIIGYRWCGNVGRQHKSNNIMYVADLRQGVYYQKCYDPECQAVQYRSQELPLPQHLLLGYYFKDDIFEEQGDLSHDDGDGADIEDEQLLTAIEDAELLQELDDVAVLNTSL